MFIEKAQCQMGKYSNNIEIHGEEHVQAWTIPIAGVLLYAHQLEELLHDSFGSEAFYVKAKDDTLDPRPWVTYAKPIGLTEVYEGMAVTIKLGDDAVSFDRCRIKDISLGRFMQGGVTQIDFKLQIAPGLDHDNLLLQEYQHEPVVLTIESAKVAAKKKSKQTDWLTQAAVPEQAEIEGPAASEERVSSTTGTDDPLYPEVLRWVLESRITTLGGVQMQFRIDQFRAGAILVAMEDAGVVGPVRDDNSREIFDGATQFGPGDEDEGGDSDDELGIEEHIEVVDKRETVVVPDPETAETGVWPMAAPGSEELPTSRKGRAIASHAKREARKRGRKAGNSDARPH